MSQSKWALGLILVGFLIFSYFILRSFNYGSQRRAQAPELKELVVFTHSSFMSSFGPGPDLAENFEKQCGCKVTFVQVGSGDILIERLKLKPEEHVDVVIGLDQISAKKAFKEVRWEALEFPKMPLKKQIYPGIYKWFLPYEYSPMTFIYRKNEFTKSPSWQDLESPNIKLSLQDPRTSSTGMQLFFWLFTEFGVDGALEKLNNLKNNIHSFSPNWSAAYGLFKKEQANLTFSYLTSVVYHWVEENDFNYEAAQFPGKHPFQVNYMAVPKRCINCKMAKRFVDFMLHEESQKVIMEKNFMLPVRRGVEKNTAFEKLPHLELIGFDKLEDFDKNKDQLMEKWEKSFRGEAG